MEAIRLEIGAGNALEAGWLPWDIKDGNDARSIRYESGTVDEIRAVHVLEHVGYFETLPTLIEWHRVLKPGGRLYVAVPDFEKIALAMFNGCDDPNLERYIVGGQTDKHDFHFALFWRQKLAFMLEQAGFCSVEKAAAYGTNTSNHWVSLNMSARKKVDVFAGGC